jgi:hypothetical protein
MACACDPWLETRPKCGEQEGTDDDSEYCEVAKQEWEEKEDTRPPTGSARVSKEPGWQEQDKQLRVRT